MKKLLLVFCVGSLVLLILCLLYQVGRAGDSPETSKPTVSEAKPQDTPAATTPETVSNAPPRLLKGSGSFLVGELEETGGFLLSVQDELEAEKKYLLPKGLTIQEGEKEIQPSELQKGDILDIDYLLSEKGERVVTHVDVVIAAKEKEIRVEAPALGTPSQEVR